MASEEWFSLSLQTKSFAAAAARFEIKQIFSFLIFEPWFFWSRRRCNTWLTLLSLCLLSYFRNYLLFRKYSTGHDDFVSNWEKIEKLSSLTSRLKAEKTERKKNAWLGNDGRSTGQFISDSDAFTHICIYAFLLAASMLPIRSDPILGNWVNIRYR